MCLLPFCLDAGLVRASHCERVGPQLPQRIRRSGQSDPGVLDYWFTALRAQQVVHDLPPIFGAVHVESADVQAVQGLNDHQITVSRVWRYPHMALCQ